MTGPRQGAAMIRRTLPQRRAAETFTVVCRNQPVTITAGFDGKLVIAGREVQVAFDIRARLDGACSDQGIDIEPPCALNRRPSALLPATITAHFSGPDFPKLIG